MSDSNILICELIGILFKDLERNKNLVSYENRKKGKEYLKKTIERLVRRDESVLETIKEVVEQSKEPDMLLVSNGVIKILWEKHGELLYDDVKEQRVERYLNKKENNELSEYERLISKIMEDKQNEKR